ncbi:hypothetical protein K1719_029744 [Acacia pycnantha]|nr:hypothetical protein K1719_029744 [Acacia pycnantha]
MRPSMTFLHSGLLLFPMPPIPLTFPFNFLLFFFFTLSELQIHTNPIQLSPIGNTHIPTKSITARWKIINTFQTLVELLIKKEEAILTMKY